MRITKEEQVFNVDEIEIGDGIKFQEENYSPKIGLVQSVDKLTIDLLWINSQGYDSMHTITAKNVELGYTKILDYYKPE